MEIKEFIEFYENLNKKETEKNGSYGEGYTWIEHRQGKEKIDFLEEFTQVFNNYAFGDLEVDENIGFICIPDLAFYINKSFLEFCLENKLYNDKARDFYHFQLETFEKGKFKSYKEAFLLFNK